MTLKEFCKQMSWQRLRRWKDAIAKVKNPAAKVQAALHDHVHTVYGGEVGGAVKNHEVSGRWMRVVICDVKYRILDRKGWELILNYSGLDTKQYVSDYFDCDNFAICFSAECAKTFHINSAGIILDFSGKHAYSAFPVMQDDGTIEIAVVEPQNDRYVVNWGGMYNGEFGIAIFA